MDHPYLLLFALIIYSCSGSKDIVFEKNPPFTISNVYIQDWVAGVQEGGSGTNISFVLKKMHQDVSLIQVFYEDRITEVRKNNQQADSYSANFLHKKKPDIVMDGNVILEASNIPPERAPFKVASGEVVISYEEKGDLKYVKIKDVEKKQLLTYPSLNPNSID